MRKWLGRNIILLFIFLAVGGTTLAQDDFHRDISQHIVFENLDKDEIKTGILHDKALPFSKIENFTGNRDSQTTSLKNWRQMYFEMYRGSLEKPFFPTIDTVRDRGEKHRRSVRGSVPGDAIPIAVMYFNYNTIKPDALEKGLIRIENGRLRRAGPSTDSPYEEKRVFAAAALKEKTYRGHHTTFFMDETLYFSNDKDPATRFAIDFDDGEGYRDVHFGETVNVNYPVEGTKNVRLKSYYDSGNVLESTFLFDVKALTTPDPHDRWDLQGTILYEGMTASGEAFIYRAPDHASLENPIIFVEGFDIDNTMGWDALYDLLNQQNLLETIRGKGYDLVILNFDDATDYIQRNAYLLVDLIQKVNDEKTGDKRLMVIGASMGGLVSQYALAYMEQQDILHETRSFIAFDSPQRGANLPLGLQHLGSFFADVHEDVAFWLGKLNRPAAKQMLVYHYASCTPDTHADPVCIDGVICPGQICSYPSLPDSDPLRATFLSELADLGYPHQVRNVAISNGSGNAVGFPFEPGDQLIDLYYIDWFYGALGYAYALPDIPPSTVIFHGEIKILSCEREIEVVYDTLPYDNAPGGMRNTTQQLAEFMEEITTDHPNHCFIPTVSALDIDTPDLFYDIAADPDILNKTPFDAIYFPSVNEDHVAITPANSVWFLQEIMFADFENYLSNIIIGLKILTGMNDLDYDLSRIDMNGDNKIEMRDIIYQLQLISETRQ